MDLPRTRGAAVRGRHGDGLQLHALRRRVAVRRRPAGDPVRHRVRRRASCRSDRAPDRRTLRHAAVDARRHHHRGRADRHPDARRHRGAGAGARYRVCGGDDRLQRPGRRLHFRRRHPLSRAGRPGLRRQRLSQRAVHDGDHHAGASRLHADHAGTDLFDGAADLRQCRHHPALRGLPLHPDQPASRFLRARSARPHRRQPADLGPRTCAQRRAAAGFAARSGAAGEKVLAGRRCRDRGDRRARRPLPVSWWRS